MPPLPQVAPRTTPQVDRVVMERTEGDLLLPSQVDTLPKRTRGEAAAYPREAERLRMLGSVTVELTPVLPYEGGSCAELATGP